MIAYYREDEERDVVTRVQIQVARFAHCITTIQKYFVSIVVKSILAVGVAKD